MSRLQECERDLRDLGRARAGRQPILVGRVMAALEEVDTAERALEQRSALGLESDMKYMFGELTARKDPTSDNNSNDASLADKYRDVVTASFPDLELPDVETGFRVFGKAFVELWERLTGKTEETSSDMTDQRTV